MNGRTALWMGIALSMTACGGDKANGASPSQQTTGTEDAGGGGSSWTDGGGKKPGLALDECGLHTGYAGDDQCILPPPPDKGFQIHVGPSDYDNPEADYVLQPGDEKTTDFPAMSGNDTDVFFFYRQYRLRPSAHHVIVTVAGVGDSGVVDVANGRRVGTANISEDYPAGGIIAPEDKSVGLPLAAKTRLNVSFHAINNTDVTTIREFWMNFWYRDPSEVTQPASEWFKMGSVTFSIPPHSQQTLGPYTCNVQGDGRLLWLYGHRHANNTRFTVTRVRGSQRDVIYDADNWEEPLLLQYSSTVTNPAPDITAGKEGGWNGILDLANNDTIEWKCEVQNDHDTALRFTNQTFLGEMCIIDAEAVTSNCIGL